MKSGHYAMSKSHCQACTDGRVRAVAHDGRNPSSAQRNEEHFVPVREEPTDGSSEEVDIHRMLYVDDEAHGINVAIPRAGAP